MRSLETAIAVILSGAFLQRREGSPVAINIHGDPSLRLNPGSFQKDVDQNQHDQMIFAPRVFTSRAIPQTATWLR
jgi:hypothetical protein